MSVTRGGNPPPYMQKRSKGPHVELLQRKLKSEELPSSDKLIVNDDYGNVTAQCAKELQGKIGFTGDQIDGNFGPATRAAVNRVLGWNFDEECRKVPGITTFIQPDGTGVNWAPK